MNHHTGTTHTIQPISVKGGSLITKPDLIRSSSYGRARDWIWLCIYLSGPLNISQIGWLSNDGDGVRRRNPCEWDQAESNVSYHLSNSSLVVTVTRRTVFNLYGLFFQAYLPLWYDVPFILFYSFMVLNPFSGVDSCQHVPCCNNFTIRQQILIQCHLSRRPPF